MENLLRELHRSNMNTEAARQSRLMSSRELGMRETVMRDDTRNQLVRSYVRLGWNVSHFPSFSMGSCSSWWAFLGFSSVSTISFTEITRTPASTASRHKRWSSELLMSSIWAEVSSSSTSLSARRPSYPSWFTVAGTCSEVNPLISRS